MPAIESAFLRLEARLQSMVEGSMARLFPNSTWQMELARGLSAAQHNETQLMKGVMLAPDEYTVFLPPDKVILFLEDPNLLNILSDLLNQAAVEAGYRFRERPRLQALPTPEKDAPIQVVAQFSQGGTGQTDYFPFNREDDVPVNVRGGAFLIVDGTSLFPLSGGVVNIGRLAENHLSIQDGRVSRRHAQIRTVKSGYVIVDLGSSGGTFVNDQRISQCKLNPGDVISLAGVPIVFGVESDDRWTKTQELKLDGD
jgi:hypothetical protein